MGSGQGFSKQGFAICNFCGHNLSDLVRTEWEKNQKVSKKRPRKTPDDFQLFTHSHPITGKLCTGGYSPIHLGHEFRSDFLKIVFEHHKNLVLLFGEDGEYEDDGEIISNAENRNQGFEFWRSLTYALLAAASQVIDVPRSELDGLFEPRVDRRANIIIYDNVPGGAGYSRRIAERFDEVLKMAWKIVSSCTCETSCYDCLQTYSNQQFHHQLTRRLVADFLTPIIEQVSPDAELQNFAPNANRITLSLMADNLPAQCRMATPDTLIYLPQLTDELGLNNGSPLSWLNLLTDIIYSLKRNNQPLELIVHRLPQYNVAKNVDSQRQNHLKVLQKRLYQWIDQDLVKLYQSSTANVPTLCLNSHQTNRIACSLHKSSNDESLVWFQTRSQAGVQKVFTRLESLRSQARMVAASELADPNTTVIFLDPLETEWQGNFTISDLRIKLGIEAALSGSTLSKVVYSDRYLGVVGSYILVDLLQSSNFDSQSVVEIFTSEDDKTKNATVLQQNLTTNFSRLQINQNNLKVDVKSSSNRYQIPHSRILEIYSQDGKKHRIIFDIGMSFLDRERGKYRVKFRTYIVIEKTS